MEIQNFVLNDYKSNSNTQDNNKNESNMISKIKRKADKAFKDGKFEKAYNLYNQALQFDQTDYDLIACLIGAALNLGFIDEVFEKSDLLIKLDNSKAQGYYLKGIAYDLVFKFDLSIENFLQALQYEKEHSNIIIKNLVKTLIKYTSKEDSIQIDDLVDSNDDIDNVLKLIELTDELIKKRSNNLISLKILNFIQTLETDNYNLKAEILLLVGKYFKNDKNYDKAIMTFEECYYLSNLNDDYKLKIKSIVSISSCYLEIADLHKVIYYYHKLIDIESYLLNNSSNSSTSSISSTGSNSSNHNMINLELRIAIRQNLFTAHYKLGKLRICCFYLSEIIDIIDKELKINEITSIEPNSFDLIQIKIDASIELIKLYSIFEEFILMKEALDKILKFIENVIVNSDLNLFNEKQITNLRYFKIKCYSYLGICLAGLRDYRLSSLSIRKCLCLIDREIQLNLDKNQDLNSKTETESILSSTLNNDLYLLNSLKAECLLDATEASNQIIKTYNQMKIFNLEFGSELNKNNDKFDAYEQKILIESYNSRLNTSKSAYLLSKTLIDPNLRAQTTFTYALNLYKNQFFQSAAYYFNEVLSISTVLLDKKSGIENQFYSDAYPDYKLEASVYLYKCHLLIDYYEMESVVKLVDENSSKDSDDDMKQIKKIDFETLYKKLLKIIEILIKHNLKWKLHETNRSSFKFNSPDLERFKHDKDSTRLKSLFKICSECLIYVCYKLNKKEESLVYMELEKFILTSTMNDLIDLKLIDMNNEFNFSTLSFENFLSLLDKTENSLMRYKFIFDCKLLYVFILEPSYNNTKTITYFTKIKLSQILNKYDVNENLIKLNDSKFDYLFRKFEIIQNEWVKNHLHEIEYRSVPVDMNDLGKTRIQNRAKEKSYFNYLVKKSDDNKENVFFKFTLESINLVGLRLSDKLVENMQSVNIDKVNESPPVDKDYGLKVINELNEIFLKLILEPIQFKILDIMNSNQTFSILIDSQYSKMFVYTLNTFNLEHENKISYIIIFDSFLKYSSKLVDSIAKDEQENNELEKKKQTILSSPNRSKSISNKCDSTNSESVHKSMIKPRYTSNPRLAVNLINQSKDSDYVLIRNDHVQKLKNRLDASVSVLISETVSGTDSKRSNLEILDYKQVNRKDKSCVIGCPEIPKKYYTLCNFKTDRFLKNGFDQLIQVGKLMYTEPIFSNKMTKKELINQLQTNNLIFLSTLSSNESDSYLICSQSIEFPSSYCEYEKYCKLTVDELDLLDMYKCNLLVLNCYSTLSHKPRFNLVKKLLSRGCKSVLFVLSPLSDKLISEIYFKLFENLKKEINIPTAYSQTLFEITKANPDVSPFILNSSLCLTGTKSIKLSINELGKSMIQLNVDKTFEHFKTEQGYCNLNPESTLSILSPDFISSLEKTLKELQILIKFLLNELINNSESTSFNMNSKYENIFSYLNELLTKSIFYIKSNKIGPELMSSVIDENIPAQNLLKCLGFGIQRSSVVAVRDEKEKKVVLFPDNRYLDLNVRVSHVMASLINLCFKITENDQGILNETNQRIKSIVFNLESLLPFEERNLLKCLIDIIALSKFSPEIILSLTDYTVYYAMNFYEDSNSFKNSKYLDLIEKDLYKWNLNIENSYDNRQIEISSSDLSIKYSINNKIVNFLMSIGFEIIGTWLRFNDSHLNQIFLDLILKILTSFTLDRDMTLYKELNINVLGQRSAATRGLLRTSSYLNKIDLKDKKDEIYKMFVTTPWGSTVETLAEMDKKIEFAEKYKKLSKKISEQRENAFKHHISYVMKQSNLGKEENKQLIKEELKPNENVKKINEVKKIKYKPGGTPSKDRIISNEKLNLTYDQLEELRTYSHLICKKNTEKIDLEFKEKSQKLLLPLIKK